MEQHSNYDPPQWEQGHRRLSLQNLQRQEEQTTYNPFETDRDYSSTYYILGITLIVVIMLLMPYLLATFTSPPKRKAPVSKKTDRLELSQAEEFLGEVEKIPSRDKFAKFHKEINGKKAKVIELLVKEKSRTTLYAFEDNSLLEISEINSSTGVVEEIEFKSI